MKHSYLADKENEAQRGCVTSPRYAAISNCQSCSGGHVLNPSAILPYNHDDTGSLKVKDRKRVGKKYTRKKILV